MSHAPHHSHGSTPSSGSRSKAPSLDRQITVQVQCSTVQYSTVQYSTDNDLASNTVQEAGVSVITNDECRDLYNIGLEYMGFNSGWNPYPNIGR